MADVFLCNTCLGLAPDSLTSLRNFTHKATHADLEQSAKTCKLCALIDGALPRQGSYGGRTYDLKPDSGPIMIRGDFSLDANRENLRGMSGLWVDCYFSHGQLSVYNQDPQRNHVGGRQIQPSVNSGIEFIKSQLNKCIENHTKFCGSPIGRDPALYCDKEKCSTVRVRPPRVYDITNKRILPGEQMPKDANYIALSYLWGNAVPKGIRTVNKNTENPQDTIETRLISFDLAAHPVCPTTYRTAIEVATRLGVNYIWIDSICMIQDDDADRERHFSRFEEGVGQIYEDALLTLCSIGRDASHDLLIPRTVESEHVVIPFGGAPLIVTPRVKWLHGHMASGGGNATGWDTRGWTYQEWLLSSRLAYFTPSQAFFECSTVFEESGAESISAGGHDARLMLRTEDDPEQLQELWHRIVSDYSGRNLGYWSDRLNAIRSVGMQLIMRAARVRGVSNIEEIKFDLVSGLLRERLHHNLLWQARSEDLVKITRVAWDKGREKPPPSWSWATWSGEITWEMHLRATPIAKKHWDALNIKADPIPTSLLRFSDDAVKKGHITNDRIVLQDAELVEVRPGKSLAISQSYDLHTYTLEIGSKSCSQGHQMPHWRRMLALLHPRTGEIIGRGAFDAAGSVAGSVECLLVSSNPAKQNPHTFEETESLNVLLLDRAVGGCHIRVGVGELFVRTGDVRVELKKEVVKELTLI